MKKMTVLLLLVGMTAWAQIEGNGMIQTQEFPLNNLLHLEMELYANVAVDGSASKESIKITTDSNLLPLINTSLVNGTLSLAQTEWIQPSNKIEIYIGAPNLEALKVGVHEKVKWINVSKEKIDINAELGKIEVSGTARNVRLSTTNGDINGARLETKNVDVAINGSCNVSVNTTDSLTGTLDKNARLELVTTPAFIDSELKKRIDARSQKGNNSITYVKFKIKNNSWNRNHFVVVGPNRNGTTFSYGFAMMPGFTKSERWTVGTKVYELDRLGARKLLYTVSKEDEGTSVKLFQ